MRNKLSKIALAASFGLPLALTFSCSSEDNNNSCNGVSYDQNIYRCESGEIIGKCKGKDYYVIYEQCVNGVVVNNSSNYSSSSNNSSSSTKSSTLTSSSSEYVGGSCNIADYGTVNINGQIWMAKNWGCYVSGSKCYDNDPANCQKYGRLYDWTTAMGIDAKYQKELWGGSDLNHKGICPAGWHIPSDDEWLTLVTYVERDRGCSKCAGKYLKASSGWNPLVMPPAFNIPPKEANGENTYGFSALPGGYGSSLYSSESVGDSGYWWSASESSNCNSFDRISDCAFWWTMGYGDSFYHFDIYTKSAKYSVRCLQD